MFEHDSFEIYFVGYGQASCIVMRATLLSPLMQELMAKAMTFANRGKGIAQQAETQQAAESISYYRRVQETVTNRGVVPFVISHHIKPSWW